MAKAHNDLDGGRGRVVVAALASEGRNHPVELSEIEFHFAHGAYDCTACVTSAPIDAYSVVTQDAPTGVTLYHLEPVAGLWEEANAALCAAALKDRERESIVRQWEHDNPDKLPVRMTFKDGTIKEQPRPLLQPCAPDVQHTNIVHYPVPHVVNCPCGRTALVAAGNRGRPPLYCTSACRDELSRKPSIAAWVATRSATRAQMRVETPEIDCAHCGKSFTPPRGNARFCSPECRINYNSRARRKAPDVTSPCP